MFVYIVGAFRDALTVSLIFLALGFVRGHAKRQSPSVSWPSRNRPRRSRKGITNIADKIGTIYGEKAAETGHAKPSAKPNALLNAPVRLLYILQKVGRLTVQKATDFVYVL